jgi:CubicO group peptidase (beta-lactamase class C family)
MLDARRRLATWLVLSFVVSGALAEKKPETDPLTVRLQALSSAGPVFSAYVFTGEKFPDCSVDPLAPVVASTGPQTAHATFYDAELRPVTQAARPGPYAAVVEIRSEKARPMHRFVTLYRTAAAVSANLRLAAETASAFAIAPGTLRRQEELARTTIKDRPFSDWARDPKAARVLAGLYLSRPTNGPVHKYDDAFARERQWWVNLKRRLYGWDKLFPGPFVAPRPIEGEPARVVREGTPADAGVKPDTADKIDAACTAFAADTDEAFAVCVVRHGVIVLHKAYGTRDGRPMAVDTKSWMASVTKSMSASMMMMAVDQGIIGLDEPLDSFVPPLRGIAAPTPLTVRHLYTHTNGLEKLSGDDTLADIEERVADCYDAIPVGKAWAYNGGGYALGGKILEALSGEALPLFYRRHLLGPLGMDHTDVAGSHADTYSTPLDMARFGQMLCNRGAYGNLRFFRPEAFQKMLPERLTKVLGPETKKTFGIGLDGAVPADGKVKQFGHGAASAATFSVDLENDLVVIITRNRYGKNQDKHNGPIWTAIRNGLIRSSR